MPDRSGDGGFCTECGFEVSGSFCAGCGAPQHASASDGPMPLDTGSAPDPTTKQSRKRMWLVAVAVLLVAVVAFGLGYGLSRGGADAPDTAPTGSDTAVTSAGTTDVPDTTIPEPVESVLPVTSATTLTTFPYLDAVLSPDGRLIFYKMPEDRRPEGGIHPWCVQDVETFVESCADVSAALSYVSTPVWTKASDGVVWTTSTNPDVFVYDVATNTVANLTDDGIDAELVPENLGKGLRDVFPTWTSEDEQVVFFRPYRADPVFRMDLYSVGIDGNIAAFVASPTYERTFEGSTTVHGRWQPLTLPPLPVGDRKIVVEGDGAIFSVDLDSGTTTVIAEYATQYENQTRDVFEPLGVLTRPGQPHLWPVEQLDDGRLLLADLNVRAVTRGQGHPAKATSGYYLLDVPSGTLTPMFSQSPNGEYGGPVAATLSPDGSELLLVWFDSSLSAPILDTVGTQGRFVVSILEVDGIEGPIDPRELRQVYGSETDPALFPPRYYSVEWAANDTVLLSTISDEGSGSVLIELNRD